MGTCAILTDDNIRLLRQGLDLLQSIPDEAFTRSPYPDYTGGAGGHLRHCLDHYASFLDGLSGGRVDYDARERDPRIETDRRYAVQAMEQVIQGLAAMRETEAARPLTVKMDGGDDSDSSTWWSPSSAQRELQFLLSHTVHHYALIALILRSQGIAPSAEFGVAPSTLRYQQSRQPLARSG